MSSETAPRSSALKADLVSGFLVFLIALPLCLGIAAACKYPPIAGIWTAVIGGILTGFISNSELTIKGPAAGLIVIVEGAVLALGQELVPDGTTLEQLAAGYRLALGVGVTAGLIQVLFGLFRLGRLCEAAPLTPLHGMLASIGITIMAKSLFPMLGMAAPGGEPLRVIASIPAYLPNLDPTVSIIGLLSIGLLIVCTILKPRIKLLKAVPGQIIVVAVTVPLGVWLGARALGDELGDPMKFLVNVPSVLNNPAAAFAIPDFRGVTTPTGLKFVALFALIGSVESALSAQAIDLLDPQKRKTNLNRDLLAVGLANTLCSAIGALPMISEIVRSAANVSNGAQTRKANMFHGMFLLLMVVLLPGFIRMIPLAALAAMLVFTGYRLASPSEFGRAWKVGKGQLAVFVVTIVTTLATDLLIGLATGIVFELLLHRLSGAPTWTLFVPVVKVGPVKGKPVTVAVGGAAVFSTWISIKSRILAQPTDADVVVDLSATWLVDHTVMEKLHELEHDLKSQGRHLSIVGLEEHKASSGHPCAARFKTLSA